MNKKGEITIKGCFEVLSLFFILTVLSLVLIYSKFEQGVEAFWQSTLNTQEMEKSSEGMGEINTDNVKIEDQVSDFTKNQLVFEYMDSCGEIDVFSTIFQKYCESR